MVQRPHQLGSRVPVQRSREPIQEMASMESAYYDGDAVYSEYSRAIFNLLKDPVSLRTAQENSPDGH